MTVYVYKIWGGYDGFRPTSIRSRLFEGDLLELNWTSYIDIVEEEDEVWIFFKEGQRFTPGVYAKGVVHAVDVAAERVILRVTAYLSKRPLVSGDLNRYISSLVEPRRRQVFVLPSDRQTPGWCEMAAPGAPTCAERRCRGCSLWQSLPKVRRSDRRLPVRVIGTAYVNVVFGYWAVPRRSFIEQAIRPIRRGIRRTNDLFKRFKAGEDALAYPLAAAVRWQLNASGITVVDGIVPVPLSPEKRDRNELDRTRALAVELSGLTGWPVLPVLSLDEPIGRRAMKAQQVSYGTFERLYRQVLSVAEDGLPDTGRILVIDDACTEGSTFRVIAQAIRKTRPNVELIAASAVLMAVRANVANDDALLAPPRRRQ